MIERSLYPTIVGLIVLLTIFLGIVWTVSNFYNFYPVVQRSIELTVARLHDTDQSEEDEAAFEAVEHPSSDTYRDTDLPSLTVLIPAYEEAGVIRNSIWSIYRSHYPREQLTVTAIVEPDDYDTRAALEDLSDVYPIDILVVPSTYPGKPNKPRALNYAFEHVSGDIIGIVDAEVILEGGLLQEAGTALATGADFALSHLDMVNEDDGWLNLLFRAEYSYWYNQIIPAFAEVGYPIPLGGTSCFFRRETLIEISASRLEEYGSPWSAADREWLSAHGLEGMIPWDPENVTEDFELGLFLWKNGYEFAYLESVTREESPTTLESWMEQRTRWKKGKLYTFLQYLKHPPNTLSQRLHLYWQSLLPHLGPINVSGVFFVFWLANMAGAVPPSLVQAILSLGLAFVVIVMALYARGYWLVSDKPIITKARRTGVVVTTLFFYWLLQWIADIRALLQTYRGQFHWTKTEHLGRNLLEGTSNGAAGTSVHQSRGSTVEHQVARPRRLGVLAGILALAAGLRLSVLTQWSLWLDEIYTITFRAAIPLQNLLVIPWDPHPPLYFALLHYWMEIGSQAQVSAGLFSVVFSVATVAMTYLFSRHLYDDLTGLAASFLVAISTMHIHFGRTIRMYSLLTFLVLVSWYTYAHLSRESRRYQAVYVAVTTAMLYTHIYALFVLAAQHVYTILTETDHSFQRRWFGLQLIIGVLYSPWLAVLGQQVLGRFIGAGSTAIGWIPPVSTALLRDTFLMYAGYPSFYPVLSETALTWGVSLAVLFVFNITMFLAVIVYNPDDDRDVEYALADLDQASLLGTFFFVPIALPFVTSYVFFPVYFPRYALAASLPLYILVARGIVNLRQQRTWQIVFAGVILAGAVITGAGYYTGESVEDWRGMVNDIEDDVDADDLLVIQPFWVENDVMYYDDGPNVEKVTLPGSAEVTPQDRAMLANRTSAHDTVWVVRYQSDSSDDVLDVLNTTHKLTFVREDGLITIYRFERLDPGNTTRAMFSAVQPESTTHPKRLQRFEGGACP